jgi:hypothetical protein
MIKLIVDYFYDDEENPSVVRKIYSGLNESDLIKRARENEHYSKCTNVTFDIDYGNQ